MARTFQKVALLLFYSYSRYEDASKKSRSFYQTENCIIFSSFLVPIMNVARICTTASSSAQSSKSSTLYDLIVVVRKWVGFPITEDTLFITLFHILLEYYKSRNHERRKKSGPGKFLKMVQFLQIWKIGSFIKWFEIYYGL